MVSTSPRRSLWRRRAEAFVALVSCSLGCDNTPVSVRTNEPMVYCYIQLGGAFQDYIGVEVLVANTGDPRGPIDLRDAERVVFRRRRDGAEFGVMRVVSPSVRRGNYALTESTTVRGLGWRSIAAGETYELEVETQGRQITGSVVVPVQARLRIARGIDRDTIYWSRSETAASYSHRYQVLSDTSFLLQKSTSAQLVELSAIDPNYDAYRRDSKLLQSGIIGAFGLFGSISISQLLVEPQNDRP